MNASSDPRPGSTWGWLPAAVVFCLLAAPWLNPRAPGASAAFLPIALGWACAAALLFFLPWRWPPAGAWLALLGAVIAFRGPWELANIGPAWAGLGLIVLCAGFGAAAVQRPGHTMALFTGSLLAAALLSALMAVLQYFDVDRWLEPLGILNQTVPGEAFANLRQRNHLATLMALGLACLVWCAPRPGWQSHRWWMLALLMAGSAASSSRTGLLQVVLLVALGYVWRASLAPAARQVLMASLPLYVLAWLVQFTLGADWLGGAFMRFSDGGAACSSRWVLWRNVLDLIAARPWMGWGWGELDFAHYAVLYRGDRFCAILDNAHNLPLHLAVELGAPVAVLACAIVAVAVVRARPWRQSDPTRQMAWAMVAALGLHSMLEYPLWYSYFEIAFGFCLGVLCPGRPVTGGPDEPPTRSVAGGKWVRSGAAALLLAAICAVTWDFARMSQLYLAEADRWSLYRGDTAAQVQAQTWFFVPHVQFADATTRTVVPANAASTLSLAHRSLHFSPEPRVIETVLRSARALGRDDLLAFHWPRYRAAFPAEAAAFEASVAGSPP